MIQSITQIKLGNYVMKLKLMVLVYSSVLTKLQTMYGRINLSIQSLKFSNQYKFLIRKLVKS